MNTDTNMSSFTLLRFRRERTSRLRIVLPARYVFKTFNLHVLSDFVSESWSEMYSKAIAPHV